MTELNEKVERLYELIRDCFYLGDELLEIGDRKYLPVALFGILTLLLSGKELVFGEYGSGKTSSSERISSLVLGLPLEFIQTATVHAHPEQTEEKIKATIDLGALEKQGKEIVKWKIIPFPPVVIIDEINRLPVGKQNMLLNEVDRNIWSYRGETLIFQEGKSFFATINYQDVGATRLIAPLLDRFDVAVETGPLHPVRKRIIRRGIDEEILKDRQTSQELITFVLENNETGSADATVTYINLRAERFKEELEARFSKAGLDLKIPRRQEIKTIREEMKEREITEDAELFLDYLGEEVRCQYTLKKDFSRCDGCHYRNYICSDLYGISQRAEQSLLRYGQALAWMTGEEEVTLEHISAIMPYVIWHRSGLSDKKRSEVKDVKKNCSDDLYAVADALREAKKRWEEHRDHQIEAYVALQNGDSETLEKMADDIGHPFFQSLVRETLSNNG
ncbi:MAG: AAA family ATPase [Deltaproteobacteria bacterium]|nr:AAA family ATPase [Deltaproteobacteria bacterium]